MIILRQSVSASQEATLDNYNHHIALIFLLVLRGLKLIMNS